MSDDTATGGMVRAGLGRRWLVKMTIFVILLLGLGVWGLYDATSAYPNRGERYASWAKLQYLTAAATAEQGGSFGAFLPRNVTVDDPAAELARLRDPEVRERYIADANSTEGTRSRQGTILVAREAWLGGLARVGKLKPEWTSVEDPRGDLESLSEEWATANAPKPLAAYDIPLQWGFTVVGFVGGALLLMHVLRVAARRYTWDGATMTLTVPGGHAITPDDLDEVDKSKWDKFIVVLRLKQAHGTLGGGSVRIDTYQHADVEPWVLAMEEKAFPGQQETGGEGPDAGGPDEDAPEGAPDQD